MQDQDATLARIGSECSGAPAGAKQERDHSGGFLFRKRMEPFLEGKRLAAMASIGPMIKPEPDRRAIVPRAARIALCKMPASPLARRMPATPRNAWKTAIARVIYTSGPKGARLRLKTISVKTEALVARNRKPARVPARQNEVRRESLQKTRMAMTSAIKYGRKTIPALWPSQM